MSTQSLRFRFLLLTIFLALAILCVYVSLSSGGQRVFVFGSPVTPYLSVAFLDVGQGDAIFIETPDGVQILIDGGPDSSVLRQLPKQMPFLDRSINMVLATHSDKDHIAGLVAVLQRYKVKTLIHTNNKNDTAVARAFDQASNNEGALIYNASAGQQFQLGASTTLLILSPAGNPEEWESNTASIVAQLKYGEVEFLLTGDASLNIEEYVGKTYGTLIESEVLKLGHHGSRTSTADLFLDAVTPEYAIVSAGKNNRYGHPHQEVLDKLSSRNIKVLNTAAEGTILFKTDGVKVWVE